MKGTTLTPHSELNCVQGNNSVLMEFTGMHSQMINILKKTFAFTSSHGCVAIS